MSGSIEGDVAVQDALAAAIGAYVARLETEPELPPFRDEHRITATDVALTASKLLEAADIELFELGLFTAWYR
jgi:hypothetical protein